MSLREEERLQVEFSVRPVYNKRESEGWTERDPLTRAPIKHPGVGRAVYKDVDYITIRVPGELDVIDRPVWNEPGNPKCDVARFGDMYKRWKESNAAPEVGTPLQHLTLMAPPLVSPAQVAEFRHFGIRTAEQLISVPDVLAGRFMGYPQLKAKVEAYLEQVKEDAPLETVRLELAKRDEETETLREQLRQQGELIQKLMAGRSEEPAPPRRGRPPKSQPTAEGA